MLIFYFVKPHPLCRDQLEEGGWGVSTHVPSQYKAVSYGLIHTLRVLSKILYTVCSKTVSSARKIHFCYGDSEGQIVHIGLSISLLIAVIKWSSCGTFVCLIHFFNFKLIFMFKFPYEQYCCDFVAVWFLSFFKKYFINAKSSNFALNSWSAKFGVKFFVLILRLLQSCYKIITFCGFQMPNFKFKLLLFVLFCLLVLWLSSFNEG